MDIRRTEIKTVGKGLPWWPSGKESAFQSGDKGSILGQGTKIPHAVKQLSQCATTTEPPLWSPRATTTEAHMPRACVLQQEKPPQREARTPQQGVAPARRN